MSGSHLAAESAAVSADAGAQWQVQMAEISARERQTADALRKKTRLMREEQDADFHALEICIYFHIDGLNDVEVLSDYDPALWDIVDDETENAELRECLAAQAADAIKPWIEHYFNMGLVRGDRGGEPFFYLIYHPDIDAFLPASLGEFPEVRLPLPAWPGAEIVLNAYAAPVSATRLYDEMSEHDGSLCPWGGSDTPELRPAKGEGRAEWLGRVCRGPETIARAVERWSASGRSPSIYRQFGDFTEREDGDRDIEWLVPGRIPRGDLTLLVADSGAGKSSLVHEWVAALSGVAKERPTTVLGMEVVGRHFCALISAEDGPGRISQRAKAHARIWERCTYYVPPDPLISLQNHLNVLRGFLQIDLVVIDPVRDFLDGDEDSSDTANRFCVMVNSFAREMNCAVIATHHTKKGGAPRSVAEAGDRMRGSSAFKASARMVLAMAKLRDGTVDIGPYKHNFDEADVWLPVRQGERYRVDELTSTLVSVEDQAGGGAYRESGADASAVRTGVQAAIFRFNAANSIVRQSGRSGLFEMRPTELAGFSRASIKTAIVALLSDGELVDSASGLQIGAVTRASEASPDSL